MKMPLKCKLSHPKGSFIFKRTQFNISAMTSILSSDLPTWWQLTCFPTQKQVKPRKEWSNVPGISGRISSNFYFFLPFLVWLVHFYLIMIISINYRVSDDADFIVGKKKLKMLSLDYLTPKDYKHKWKKGDKCEGYLSDECGHLLESGCLSFSYLSIAMAIQINRCNSKYFVSITHRPQTICPESLGVLKPGWRNTFYPSFALEGVHVEQDKNKVVPPYSHLLLTTPLYSFLLCMLHSWLFLHQSYHCIRALSCDRSIVSRHTGKE